MQHMDRTNFPIHYTVSQSFGIDLFYFKKSQQAKKKKKKE